MCSGLRQQRLADDLRVLQHCNGKKKKTKNKFRSKSDQFRFSFSTTYNFTHREKKINPQKAAVNEQCGQNRGKKKNNKDC